MAADRKNNSVHLPQSASDFFQELKSQNCLAQFAGGITKRKSFPPELQQILNYSWPGLIIGRPLSKVMIALVGQSGAGKSTTINYLFNDKICATSDCTSETRAVTEYGKDLCASTDDLPSIIGALSFVDPPGALDVDESKETINLATISKFRSEHPDLQPRKGMFSANAKIRENVYPNLVLMVIHASDNRMRGPDSMLRKCLKALEKYRVLDRMYPNLLVVVTHSMVLGHKQYFIEETARITALIQEAVLIVLRIRDVKVVFVENSPERCGLEKSEDSDFYHLPNGQLSHYNLIKAIDEHFDQCGDLLGKLFCGWYFADDCPEKQDKVKVFTTVKHSDLTDAEVKEALHVLASLQVQLNAEEDIILPKFNFPLLGHGYCPRTEVLKHVTVYSEADTVRAKLLGVLYTIPKCVFLKEEQKYVFFPVTYETKETYDSKRAISYKLEDGLKVVTSVEPTNRWLESSSENKESVLRSVYEQRFATAKIPEPETQVKAELIQELNLLPPTYHESNAHNFSKFFLKWGTHFIQEVNLGGYLGVDCPVNTAEYNDKQGRMIVELLSTAFKSIKSLEKRGREYRQSFDGSGENDIQNCSLFVEGGDPFDVTRLTELTSVSFTDWSETVKSHPTELPYSFILHPYYGLVKDSRRKALQEATIQYLDGTMPKYIPLQRENSFYDTAGIKRKEVAQKMVESAKLEASQRNKTCNVM